MTVRIFSDIESLEVLLALPGGFYDRILREDDWSFVIKLNALFEGVCTEVLSSRLSAPEILSALAHLDFGNTKCGKITMLRALDAITSEQATVLRALAELRNDLVHNISKVHFSFEGYLASRDTNQLKSVLKTFGHGVCDQVSIGGKTVPRHEFVTSNPKMSLWLTAAEVLACLHLEFVRTELRLEKSALEKYARIAHGKQ
jgi:hypothetical protein